MAYVVKVDDRGR